MRLRVISVLKEEKVRISRIMPKQNDLQSRREIKKGELNGAADGTRTRNSQLGRLMLYQLNYRRKGKAKRKNGRGDWIRTSDPLLPKQLRYQAALHPEPREKYR